MEKKILEKEVKEMNSIYSQNDFLDGFKNFDDKDDLPF